MFLGCQKKFVYAMQELKIPLFDQFLNGLQKSKFGNIKYRSESGHLVRLCYLARPVRRSGNDDKLTSICNDLNALKGKISNNLQENAANQTVYC